MSGQSGVQVFQGVTYACLRCGTKASQKELEALPSPRCGNCGYGVFAKVRSGPVKQVSAV